MTNTADNEEKSTADENNQELEFEKALERLEKIVAEMESGDLSLQKNMHHFEEGMKLVKYCNKKLGETEKKIEVLVDKNKDGGEWEDFEQSDDNKEQSGDTETFTLT